MSVKLYSVRWYCPKCNEHHRVEYPARAPGEAVRAVAGALMIAQGGGAFNPTHCDDNRWRLVAETSFEVVEGRDVERHEFSDQDLLKATAGLFAHAGETPEQVIERHLRGELAGHEVN